MVGDSILWWASRVARGAGMRRRRGLLCVVAGARYENFTISIAGRLA